MCRWVQNGVTNAVWSCNGITWVHVGTKLACRTVARSKLEEFLKMWAGDKAICISFISFAVLRFAREYLNWEGVSSFCFTMIAFMLFKSPAVKKKFLHCTQKCKARKANHNIPRGKKFQKLGIKVNLHYENFGNANNIFIQYKSINLHTPTSEHTWLSHSSP